MCSISLAAARRHLQKVADELETLQLTMLGIQRTLSEPPAEAVKLLDVEEIPATLTALRDQSSWALPHAAPAATDSGTGFDAYGTARTVSRSRPVT